MKKLLLVLLLLQATISWTQTRLIERRGTIDFRASKETFVPVKAQNKNASAIVDLQSGTIASLVLVKEFVFKNALMQEHFNENYMESDRYPKITFQGKIAEFSIAKLEGSPTTFWVKGMISIHGVKRAIEVPMQLSKRNAIIYATSRFSLKPEDFNIKIPKIVRYKIAKEVIITLDFKLQTP